MEHRDAWYVGFVPEYTTAVWVGFPDEQRQLVDVVAHGQRYDRVFGGTVPAPIWGEFMEYVLQDVPESDFPADPPGVNAYFKVPTTVVPSVVGLDQQAALAVLREARLIGNSSDVVSLEPRGTVLSQSIGAGAEVVQGTSLTIGVSTGEIPKTAMPRPPWHDRGRSPRRHPRPRGRDRGGSAHRRCRQRTRPKPQARRHSRRH